MKRRKRPAWRTKKQAGFLKRHGMPISAMRAIVRADGHLCLRCLSRPRDATGTLRCYECKREREEANKCRKR